MATTSPEAGAEYQSYRTILARDVTLDPSEWSFKSDPWYRAILEHVSYEQGLSYVSQIRTEFPEIWNFLQDGSLRRLTQRNDLLGKPVKYVYPTLDLSCSPTNFRYLYHALIILKHISLTADEHKAVNIIELGGGYGGLAFYIQELAGAFGVEVSYTIVDLPEAAAMQSAYAEALNYWLMMVASGNDADSLEKVLLNNAEGQRYFVSAYAFSEFSREVRDWYVERLVNHCDHGFLVWNINPLYDFIDKPISIEAERPLTGPGNVFVRF